MEKYTNLKFSVILLFSPKYIIFEGSNAVVLKYLCALRIGKIMLKMRDPGPHSINYDLLSLGQGPGNSDGRVSKNTSSRIKSDLAVRIAQAST